MKPSAQWLEERAVGKKKSTQSTPRELVEQMLGQYSGCLPSKKGCAGVGLERARHHTAHIPQERLWVSLK